MSICIPPQINRKLKQAFESGKINVDNFIKMNGGDRQLLIDKTMGKGYSDTINNSFIKKFNTELDDIAIKDIVDSISKVNELRIKDKSAWIPGEGKEWSREYIQMVKRVQSKLDTTGDIGIIGTIKQIGQEEIQKIKDQPDMFSKVIQGGKLGGEILTSAVYKSLKASADLSFALRQGFKILTKNPKQWSNSMVNSFDVIKNIKSQKAMDAVMDEFKASYLAHPNYEKLMDGKLAFGVVEDFFPTSIAEKIPKLGNIFKASNEAFTIFSQSARFGLADDMLNKQMQMAGRELTKDEITSIAKVANSITGRGGLGRLESVSGALNKLFFSARYVKSQIDTFTMPFNNKLTPFAKKEALNHSVKTLGTIGGILATASFFGDVELDPRSSKFGKMKVGNNWIDLTAGLGSYIALAYKQISGETKSTSGKINKLNTGEFGSQTRGDVLSQWFQGKLAPAPSTINQVLLKGKTFQGEKPTVGTTAESLLAPISASNVIDYLTNEDLATALLLSGADMIGIGVTQPIK